MKTDEKEVSSVQQACQNAAARYPGHAVSATVATVFDIDSKLDAAVGQLTTLASQLKSALMIDSQKVCHD